MSDLSLNKFCIKYQLARTTVHRKAQELGINTSKGLNLEAQNRILEAFGLSTKATSDALDVEVLEAVSLERYMPAELATPDVFNDPVGIANLVCAKIDEAARAVEASLEEKRRKLSQLGEAQRILKAKKAQVERQALDRRIEEAVLNLELGKSVENLKELL